MKKLFFPKLTMIIIVLMTIFSCSDDEDTHFIEVENSYGLIANVSPNSGDLYFFADGNKINSSALNYPNVQGYYRFYEGSRKFSVQDSKGNVLATSEREVKDGDIFSLFAVNTFDQLELISFEDHLVAPGFYNAGIRLINLSPDAPSINLYLNGNLITSNIPFKIASPFTNVEDNVYDVEIQDSQTGAILYKQSSVTFYPNRIYTLYTKGFVNLPSGSNDQFSLEIIRNY